jgi:hypothetical protein
MTVYDGRGALATGTYLPGTGNSESTPQSGSRYAMAGCAAIHRASAVATR